MDYKEFQKNLEEIIIRGYKFHHSAKARGYQRVADYFVEDYCGKYGEGFIGHYPTKEDLFCSNRYHRIEYYIKK